MRRAGLLTVIAALLAGCGHAGPTSQTHDPAAVLPTGGIGYVAYDFSTTTPAGRRLHALLKTRSGREAADQYRKTFDRILAQLDPDLGFDDVSRFADGHLGAVFYADSGAEPHAIIALGVRDTHALNATLNRLDDHPGKIEGVPVGQREGVTAGVIRGELVLAQAPEDFARAVRATRSGHVVAQDPGYRHDIARLEGDRVLTFRGDLRRFAELSARSQGASPLTLFEVDVVFGRQTDSVGAVSLHPHGATLEVDGAPFPLAGTYPPEQLRKVPRGSWLTFGTEDLYGAFSTEAGGELATGLRGLTGLESGALSWAEGAAAWVHGSSYGTLRGALVIETFDRTAAHRTVNRLLARSFRRGQAFRFHIPGVGRATDFRYGKRFLTVAWHGNDLVVGLGGKSVEQAVRARARSGTVPTASVDMRTFARLGLPRGDPDRELLASLGKLTLTTEAIDDGVRTRVTVDRP